ncbi:Exoribonuclease, phosphorolytic domain 1 [Kalmanozyma brasiliensis GHG001]|uniref:Ribosomal RNA-processing protein 43 n=1 Tax=Kalmanozyma brasiliensis (strain GHG001) TaxID=1365824 RepID=V5ECU9_KALBG|nr:Exoribonuclease, phosphorolytic domain 1 [Kalmanozyma brasiliensis GHG001]EST08276.1 Exoribonuclease, phosphorolytic domain 1 [Kalmanozyma brasiliensis GHG001]
MSAASVAGPSASTSSAPVDADLVATTFKRLHPISYLSRFLDSSIREDGRALPAFRDATLTLGSISTADGSSFIRIGNTSCIAAVKAEVAPPQLSRPSEGYLIPNVELPAVCSSKFKPGAPGEEAQVLTSRLLALLNSSNALNREHLCIEESKAVWCLYLDISFICFDGNAIDAAVLAAVAALSHTTLPKATYDQDTEQVRCSSSPSDRSPLQLDEIPFASSFSIFENQHLLSDPTAFEAALSSSHATIAISLNPSSIPKSSKAKPTVTFLYQSGRLSTASPDQSQSATDQQNLRICIDRAYSRAQQLATLLRDAQEQSS